MDQNKDRQRLTDALSKLRKDIEILRKESEMATATLYNIQKEKDKAEYEYMQLMKLLYFNDVVLVPDGEPADINSLAEIDEFIRRQGEEHKAQIVARKKVNTSK